MKEQYAEKLIDNINRRYNGRIIELEDSMGLLTKWAVKINNYTLIFTDYSEAENLINMLS